MTTLSKRNVVFDRDRPWIGHQRQGTVFLVDVVCQILVVGKAGRVGARLIKKQPVDRIPGSVIVDIGLDRRQIALAPIGADVTEHRATSSLETADYLAIVGVVGAASA